MGIKEQIRRIIKEALNEAMMETSNNVGLDIERLFHFSEIPTNELASQYCDLSFIVSTSGYGGHFMGTDGRILKEEAHETLSIEETKSEIINKFKFKDWQFATQRGANNIQLVLLYPGILKNSKLLKEAMSACGWSLAYKSHIFKNKMLWRAMSFEPIFQENVANEARKEKFLYHWSPFYNLEKIMAQGLLPKSKNQFFDYPERLHLIKGNTSSKDIMFLGKQLSDTNKTKQNNGKYILFSIATDKIPITDEIYYDPRYEEGYYMKVPISANAIKPIFGYNFKTNERFNI